MGYVRKNPQKPQTKEYTRESRLKRVYGITLEELRQLLTKQDWKCGICRTPLGIHGSHVDHCHETGAVRGVLCVRCNPMLGQARDSIDILLSAVDYLQSWNN